jgi:DNA polymerase-1
MLLQVHDETCVWFTTELEQMKEMIKYEMENAFKLDVPLDVN